MPAGPDLGYEPARDRGDGTRVRLQAHGHCRDGAEVLLYIVEGVGHAWRGRSWDRAALTAGRTSRDVDASALTWSFFARHALAPVPVGG